ncbi:unnamed protein product [Protopolystoma xenopodis]|uniref:Uncharacterized protein n=1 Tax=Protopolystoma xenopodis TaxID=117903 RepID=A0A3S5CPQ4_9PLAT|nr:unnamed protein product [Protopolystoma xenopodis]
MSDLKEEASCRKVRQTSLHVICLMGHLWPDAQIPETNYDDHYFGSDIYNSGSLSLKINTHRAAVRASTPPPSASSHSSSSESRGQFGTRNRSPLVGSNSPVGKNRPRSRSPHASFFHSGQQINYTSRSQYQQQSGETYHETRAGICSRSSTPPPSSNFADFDGSRQCDLIKASDGSLTEAPRRRRLVDDVFFRVCLHLQDPSRRVRQLAARLIRVLTTVNKYFYDYLNPLEFLFVLLRVFL